MSYDYDYTEINATNAPWHWVRLIKWLKGDGGPHDPAPADASAQLAKLDPSYVATLNFVQGIDIGDVHGATIPAVSLTSALGVSPARFTITDQDSDVDDVEYRIGSGSWISTGLTKWVKASWTSPTLAAGSTSVFTFRGQQGASTYSAVTLGISVTVIPAVPTTLAVDTTGVATWDAMSGAVSYAVQYQIQHLGTGSFGNWVNATPTAATFTVPGVVSTDVVRVRVAATNAGGTSAQATAVTATIA
jgi:hypothetical protein